MMMRMIMTKEMMMMMMTTLRAADQQTVAAIAMEGLPQPDQVPEKEAVRGVAQEVQAMALAAHPEDRTILVEAQIVRLGEDRETQGEVAQAPVEVLRAPGVDLVAPHLTPVLPLTARVQARGAGLPQ